MSEKVKSKKSEVRSAAFCLFTFTFCLTFSSLLAQAETLSNPDKLFSPSAGQRFYEIAYELANSEDIDKARTEQALVFLIATKTLDDRANHVWPDMIKLACRNLDRDYSKLVYQLLANYVDESADLEVTAEAVRYLLEQLDSREDREKLLGALFSNLRGKNKVLDSDLATSLGILMTEKPDDPNAVNFFMHAYNSNKYNRPAFAKLAELVPNQIQPAIYLERLRLALGENPLDLEAALAFAEYAEQLQLFQTAADAYEYCADLFAYLYPSEVLPRRIYLPWIISSYNTQRNQHKCLQIVERLRQGGHFDLLAEAIAGKAAAKIGNTEQADQILQAAEDKAQQLLIDDSSSQKVTAEQLAWFYCFARPDADEALDWANKAYSVEPDSTTAAILAYSLVMNGQNDWAGQLIDSYEKNQIAALALAQIQLAQEKQNQALETLKSAIAKDPGALEAEHAKEILTASGGEYISPTDPDIILTALRGSLGRTLVPAFLTPDKIISVQLNVRGSKFSYGSDFDGNIAITNNSSEPLVVSDDGLFKGNIRVDADIRGDINKKIPNLISIRIRPASLVEPGRSMLVPLRLATAELRQILLTYPQASLDLEFTVYLDPVATDDGGIANRLQDIKPATVLIKRPGVELTGKFLRNRFNSLSKGQQGQKIKTALLFVGLLMEQQAMANREPLYKFMYADWMQGLLKSALLHNLTHDDWVAKVHTMSAMLSLPLDYELTNAVSENLNDTHWPARLMAMYLLAKKQGGNFDKVLNWSAKYDSSKIVRDMAVALGAVVPQPPKTAGQPVTDDSKK